ncbi:MAG TPA: hypothetical protein VKD65_16335 [Candidatus Angelobacter sp.]|nr:hypothetical protein [Candidatus Angelobacter sp.]
METVTDTGNIAALGFPTATPILDVLHPQPRQESERLTTGDYFFISSAVILAFTELSAIRTFVDSISHQSSPVFWTGLLLLPLIAFIVAVVVHQAGHLLAGRIAGFEAVKINFRRFTLREKLEPTDVLSLGLIVMRPLGADRLRRRLTYLVAGGPLASLLVPVLLETGLRVARSYWGTIYFLVPAGIHLLSALSILLGVGSLLPDIDASGNFSDGTRLLMLLKNDFRASRWLAILELQQGLNAPEHPNGWGEDLIARALGHKDESFDTVAANWLGYLWASARQDLGQATKCLEEALTGLATSPGHLRDRIFLEAAVFQAWYRHNLFKAQLWQSQILDPESLPAVERQRLEIASVWAEGKSFDAWEQLQDYLLQVRKLPESPLRASLERDALEWKAQMESRMLAGAWATMHSWPYQRQIQRLAWQDEVVST